MAAKPHSRTGNVHRVPSPRNLFPGELWFQTPHRVYTSGQAKVMGMAEFKRYCTLLLLWNFKGDHNFQVSKKTLEMLDGVSSRRAFDVTAKLTERGLILLDTSTKPFTYTLRLTSEWKELGTRLRLVNEGKTIRVEPHAEAPPWV